MIVCEICKKSVKGFMGLSKHIIVHNICPEEYTLKYFYNNVSPLCKCGCGEKTLYINKQYRFNSYIHNHHNYDGKSTLGMKVHTSESLQKALESRRKTCLDKYGVDSVMKIKDFSNKVRKTKSDHPMWKGGTSSLVQMLRADWTLYIFWKKPILERDGFKCFNCEDIHNLNVHHDKIRMCDVIKLFIPEDKHELSYFEKKIIINKVVQYHVENKVSGITLCKKCHKELHNSYNL